jgi:SNF family Na+-dependent transporter
MMDQEYFYKDQYDGALKQKNEINSSLATPISLLTALTAALYFAATTFDYSDNIWLTVFFIPTAGFSTYLIGRSIFHLTTALSDFHNGYDYAYLNDTDVLNNYYQDLLSFYGSLPLNTDDNVITEATKEFNQYLLKELIKSAGINQKNNKSKIYQRFLCHKFMIYALIALSLLIVPFGIDFGINKVSRKADCSIVETNSKTYATYSFED